MNDVLRTGLKAVDLKTGSVVPYVPLPSQRAFHASQAMFRAFIAGIGNGKSNACCAETLFACFAHPGSKNVVCRWDQTRLKGTTWETLRQMIRISGLECLIVDEVCSLAELRIDWLNGSTIIGMNAKNWKQFGGLEISSFFIDEVAELPDDEVYLQLCARVERHPIGPNRGWICGLPDGQNWYWERFFQKKLPDHQGFIGNTFQNPYQKSGYADRLVAIYGKERAATLVMGAFDVIEGRLLEMLKPETHVLARTLPMPKSYPRYCAVDPGRVNDPAAMLRVVVDPYGNIIIEAEYERFDRITEEFTRDILAFNQLFPPEFYIMDKSAFSDTHQSALNVADTARKAGMSPLYRADNNPGYVEQGIARLRSLLTPQEGRTHPITKEQGCFPQLYLFDDCPLSYRELKSFRMLKAGAASAMNGVRLPDHGHDLVDCFVAGTMITTPTGEVTIETLKPGDLVMTRDGARPVLVAKMTGERDLVRVDFSDGRFLIGTPSHPVWSVEQREFVRMDSLLLSGEGKVSIWNKQTLPHPSRSITKVFATGDTPTPSSEATESTIKHLSTGSPITFIADCMKTITALSRRVMRFITGMRTHSTTIPRTWNAYRLKNTVDCATKDSRSTLPARSNEITSNSFDRSRLSGTIPLRGSNGIGSTAETYGRDENPERLCVSSVEKCSSREMHGMSPSALQSAETVKSTPPVGITKIEPVPAAETPFAVVATSLTPGAAVVRALSITDAGTAPVYNLRVAGTPEYYANGVLVHNCLMWLSLRTLEAPDVDTHIDPMDNPYWREVLNLGKPSSGKTYLQTLQRTDFR